MRRALFAFHAPARALSECTAVAALLSLLLGALGFSNELVPWLACAAAWITRSSWSRLMIPAPGSIERAWPIPEQQALWTRVLAAWSFCWVPALASQLALSALCVLGRVTPEHWRTMLGQSACLICLAPLCSAALHAIDSRPVAVSIFAILAALVAGFVPFAGLLAGVHGIYPPWPFDLATLALAFGIVHFSRQGAKWEHSLTVAVTPRVDVARPKPVALSATVRAGNGTRWAPLWFFYRHGALSVAGLVTGALALTILIGGHVTILMWTILSQSFLLAYLGANGKNAWAGYLPISRDRQFAWVFAPLCLLAVASTGVEAFWGSGPPARVTYAHSRKSSWRQVASKVDTASRSLEAPALYWRATLGEPPMARSSEGELHPIPSYPVFSGLPLRVYNPFDVWQWEDPVAFADHVSQMLREQYQLPVTRTDVLLADPEVEKPSAVRWLGCQRGGLQATCGWPSYWLAFKFGLLAWLTWAVARAQLHERGHGWRRNVEGVGWLIVYWALAMVLHFALEPLRQTEPEPNTWFEGAVVVGELARALAQQPLLSGATTCLVLALYWNLLRRYRRAELLGTD